MRQLFVLYNIVPNTLTTVEKVRNTHCNTPITMKTLNSLIASIANASSSAADSVTKQVYAVTDSIHIAFHPTPRMVALKAEFLAKRRHLAEESEMQRLLQQGEAHDLRQRHKQERETMAAKHKEVMTEHQKSASNFYADFKSKWKEATASAKAALEQARLRGQTAKQQEPTPELSVPALGSEPAAAAA